MPLFKKINTDSSMNAALVIARERALKEYKKVYLDPSVRMLSYTGENGLTGLLTMGQHLSMLKAIGTSYEPFRPKAENVFVPQLFLIVQKENGEEEPQFIEIPLLACECKLNHHPLSCYSRDSIFPNGPNEQYFNRVKNDYISGSVIQGKAEQAARQEISKKVASQAARSTELIHSERVMMELFRSKTFIQQIVHKLACQLEAGEYRVHGVLMLAYSTNSVCPQCTPTLITLMNSHDKGQFLALLTSELDNYKGDSVFYVPKVEVGNAIDWTQFRMNICVTASTVFDCQSHYSTEPEQYKGTKYKKKPTEFTSNHHQKLHRPDDTFDISETPLTSDNNPDSHQRFFYEFVGSTIHTTPAPNHYKDRLVFTSGGSKGIWDRK